MEVPMETCQFMSRLYLQRYFFPFYCTFLFFKSNLGEIFFLSGLLYLGLYLDVYMYAYFI